MPSVSVSWQHCSGRNTVLGRVVLEDRIRARGKEESIDDPEARKDSARWPTVETESIVLNSNVVVEYEIEPTARVPR